MRRNSQPTKAQIAATNKALAKRAKSVKPDESELRLVADTLTMDEAVGKLCEAREELAINIAAIRVRNDRKREAKAEIEKWTKIIVEFHMTPGVIVTDTPTKKGKPT